VKITSAPSSLYLPEYRQRYAKGKRHLRHLNVPWSMIGSLALEDGFFRGLAAYNLT
jgi:hypothetical protein